MVKKTRKGIAALVVVMVIAAAGLLLAAGAVFLGLDSLSISVDRAGGAKALALAEGCFNLGLRRLQLDGSYLGETLSLDGGSCIIEVSPDNGHLRLGATAILGEYSQAVQAEIVVDAGRASILNFVFPENF